MVMISIRDWQSRNDDTNDGNDDADVDIKIFLQSHCDDEIVYSVYNQRYNQR